MYNLQLMTANHAKPIWSFKVGDHIDLVARIQLQKSTDEQMNKYKNLKDEYF